ncbi:MAG: UUP1 family membrane protein [Betaproteobacteria bacterium]|nr:UUP1 family membrane protein [Betaproteobacteria bacterium]
MKRVHLYLLAGILAAIGIGVFFHKFFVLGFPLKPEERTDVWRVEVQLQFEAAGGPVKASLFVPYRTGDLAIVDQSFVSPGYGIVTEPQPGHGMRAAYSIREARGTQAVYYRAVIQPARVRDEVSRAPTPVLQPPELEGAQRIAAEGVVGAARQRSSDAATLASLIVKWLKEAPRGGEAAFLLGPQPTPRRIAMVAAQLIQFAAIPARVVNGIALAPERRDAQFTHWLEFYADGRWQELYINESHRAPPHQLLAWWRGSVPFAEITGGSELHYTIATSRSYELATRTALSQQRALERKLVEFSLFGLPLQSQALFRTLLVIPVGILLLVVLRNIVGLKTFGTFMPVLIALAFRQTGLAWGILFFCTVVGLGLAARFYLEQLKLLLVPRLAAVVIVVILIIAMLTVLSFKLGLERGLSIGLFPIVIMTMTIERMTVVWEERGAREALEQGLGSLVVGTLCYLVMNLRIVEHLFFVFPELLLAVLAVTLLIGRYSGYRLTELYRFRVLAR